MNDRVWSMDINGNSYIQDQIGLRQFRVVFDVNVQVGNALSLADIRVYNVEEKTALNIFNNFSPRSVDLTTGLTRDRGKVILQAGYPGNVGVIFQGNIKQVILGRESATDTFVDIIAGDGDRAYNFSVVNSTIDKGASALDQIQSIVPSMAEKGTTLGHVGDMPPEKLPRGKSYFGNAKNYLRNIAQSTNKVWSIQDEKITFISKKSYLPGERVLINSKTGMVGAPQQTNEGVNVKCLLNPLIKIGSRIQLNNKDVVRYKINLSVPNSPANIPAPLTSDGTYYVLVCEHSGDTRGVEWYSTLLCLNMDISTNPLNSVQPGYGP